MAVNLTCAFLDQALAAQSSKPLVFGISGPQGSGKLYLASHLLTHLHTKYPNLNSVGMLIDDFYLTNKEQKLVSEHARKDNNRILQGRGLPGTHDLKLALEVMEKLRRREFPVEIPVYDKSAFNGEGDRAPVSEWQKIEKPVDVVVFEGWFTGYKSIDSMTFPSVYSCEGPEGIVQRHCLYHLEEVNSMLKLYEPLWDMFDYFVYMKTDNLENVYRWRLEQEAALISQTGKGMTPPQVRAFVDRYMPMYCLYYWRMCEGVLEEGRNLEISIDEGRKVLGSRIK